MAYTSLPQGSLETGMSFARATAGVLKRVGLIKLLGNGWPVVGSSRVTGFPLVWHGPDSILLKSPFRTACVGTKLMVAGGAVRVLVAWNPLNRNTLSLRIGPPTVPPN